MRKSDDIHSALESVGEVAVFVWSLLELLLTRIFPLLGFLTGHLLLQCSQFLVSLLTPTSARTTRPLRRSYDIDHQRQRHGVLPHPRYFEDITNDDNRVPWQPPPFAATAPRASVTDLKTSEAQVADNVRSVSNGKEDAPPPAEDPVEAVPVDVAHSRSLDAKAAAAPTEQMEPSPQEPPHLEVTEAASLPVPVDVAHSTPLDAKAAELRQPSADIQRTETASADAPIVDKVKQDEDGYVAQQPIKKAKAKVRGRRRMAGAVEEGNVIKAPWEGRDMVKARLESIREGDESEKTSDDEEARNPSLKGQRTLPPSLSQVKRSLMQRSRRGGASASTPSPSSTSPSPSSASKESSAAPHSKRNSPRIRKLVMKSSASYHNFMDQFRKHFLLSPTQFA